MSWVVGKTIGFLTPVRYDCNAPWWEKGLAGVDSCLCWDDKVAAVIGCFPEGKRSITLRVKPQSAGQVGLKVASFVGWGLSVVVAGKALIEGRPWGRLQKMAGLVGIGGVGAVVAKGLFRQWVQFGERHYVYEERPADRIEVPIKKTLDWILGSTGTVDALPVFKGERMPENADEMSADMMKGFDRAPYIAIKITDEASQTKNVLLLSPNTNNGCEWGQFCAQSGGPRFFGLLKSFTDDLGILKKENEAAAVRLIWILMEGQGPDVGNVVWTYGPKR